MAGAMGIGSSMFIPPPGWGRLVAPEPVVKNKKGTAVSSGSENRIGETAYTTIDPASGASFSNILEQLNQQVQALSQLRNQVPQYQDLLSQGASSPLMQAILDPALAKLRPQFQDQQEALMDMFRGSGALGSSAMGQAGSDLLYKQGLTSGDLISQIMSSMLPQMTQGLGQQFDQTMKATAAPGSLLASILAETRPQVVTGPIIGSSSRSSSGGGIGGLSGYDPTGVPANWGASASTGGYMQGRQGGSTPPSWMSPDLSNLFGGTSEGLLSAGPSGGDPNGWFANYPGGYTPYTGDISNFDFGLGDGSEGAYGGGGGDWGDVGSLFDPFGGDGGEFDWGSGGEFE